MVEQQAHHNHKLNMLLIFSHLRNLILLRGLIGINLLLMMNKFWKLQLNQQSKNKLKNNHFMEEHDTK